MGYRKSGTRNPQLFGHRPNRFVRIAARAHNPEERLDIRVGSGIAVRNLGKGNHHHGFGRLAEARVVRVGDDADDLALRFSGEVGPDSLPALDVLAYGIFVGPELFGESLIDE